MTGAHEHPAWLVVIEHGQGPRSGLERLLRRCTTCRVERVRTDVAPGQVLRDPNEALEFSGYQEGLARVLARFGTDAAGDTPATVVFVNDTIASGHVRPLARLLLDTLPRLPSPGMHRPLLVGLKMPLPEPVQAVSSPQGYISTWAFALHATPAQLRAIQFYAPGEVLTQFSQSVQPGLPAAYRAWVRRWLEPVRPLSGWYKAIPGQPLDRATLQRKELTIYLEHSLLPRLHRLGFKTCDVAAMLPAHRAVWLRMLRWFDRLNVNRLKLWLRLTALLTARLP